MLKTINSIIRFGFTMGIYAIIYGLIIWGVLGIIGGIKECFDWIFSC